MKFNALIAFAFFNAGFCAFSASAENTPLEVVKSFYAPYLLSQEHKGPGPQLSATDYMKPYASTQLKALIQKENDCMEKSQGICALDWDVIIDGQDWEISGLNITQTASDAAHQTIKAEFKNMSDPVQITYYFIREDNDWKLDDVDGSAIETMHDNHVQKWKLTEVLSSPVSE